jgi:hypothetical protein
LKLTEQRIDVLLYLGLLCCVSRLLLWRHLCKLRLLLRVEGCLLRSVRRDTAAAGVGGSTSTSTARCLLGLLARPPVIR